MMERWLRNDEGVHDVFCCVQVTLVEQAAEAGKVPCCGTQSQSSQPGAQELSLLQCSSVGRAKHQTVDADVYTLGLEGPP